MKTAEIKQWFADIDSCINVKKRDRFWEAETTNGESRGKVFGNTRKLAIARAQLEELTELLMRSKNPSFLVQNFEGGQPYPCFINCLAIGLFVPETDDNKTEYYFNNFSLGLLFPRTKNFMAMNGDVGQTFKIGKHSMVISQRFELVDGSTVSIIEFRD